MFSTFTGVIQKQLNNMKTTTIKKNPSGSFTVTKFDKNVAIEIFTTKNKKEAQNKFCQFFTIDGYNDFNL